MHSPLDNTRRSSPSLNLKILKELGWVDSVSPELAESILFLFLFLFCIIQLFFNFSLFNFILFVAHFSFSFFFVFIILLKILCSFLQGFAIFLKEGKLFRSGILQ